MSERPNFPHGYLGPQSKFDEFGLHTISHSDPIITTSTNEIEVKIGARRKMRATVTLVNVKDGKEYNQHVFTHNHVAVIGLIVNMPKVGWWKLQIFTLPHSTENPNLIGVYNYAINCENVDKSTFPFPKQYSAWNEDCELFAPMHIHRDVSGPEVNFKVFISNVKQVAVVAGSEWIQLTEGPPKTWSGCISVGQYYGTNATVTLNVNRGDENDTSYDTLLEYVI